MSSQSRHREDVTHYCTECGWRTDVDGEDSETDCTEQAIRHHIETAHTIVHQSADRQVEYSRPRLSTDRL